MSQGTFTTSYMKYRFLRAAESAAGKTLCESQTCWEVEQTLKQKLKSCSVGTQLWNLSKLKLNRSSAGYKNQSINVLKQTFNQLLEISIVQHIRCYIRLLSVPWLEELFMTIEHWLALFMHFLQNAYIGEDDWRKLPQMHSKFKNAFPNDKTCAEFASGIF